MILFSVYLGLGGNLTLEGTSINDEDFSDIARHGIVEVVGDDVAGRKIIVISACRLPSNKNFDYARYLIYKYLLYSQMTNIPTK